MDEFIVHNLKEAVMQVESKYGLLWQDHYILESQLVPDGSMRVIIREVDEEQLKVDIEDIIKSLDEDLMIDDNEVNSVVEKIIEEYKDYDISVEVSEDEMKAFLTIKPNSEKTKIKREELLEFLSGENIVFGIKEKVLDRICLGCIDRSIESILIAQGKYPVASVDSRVDYLFPKDGFIKLEEEIEGSKINYARRKKIFQCREFDILIEKKPGIQGVDGITVFGKKIPVGKFKDINLCQFIENSETVQISEDNNLLIAKCDGQPYMTKYGKVEVRKVFVVNKSIDYSVGDIEFDGSVIIHGDVEIPFEVHAKGDILIDGMVRNTVVTSEGNIFIKGGVSGVGKAKIECRGSLTTSHLNNVTVIVDGNCISEDYILNSVVYSGDNIVIHGRGLFSGGALFARNNISMKVAGSQAGVKTTISAGIRYMKMIEEYKRNSKVISLMEKINELKTADLKITRQIKMAETQQKRERLSVLQAKIRLAKQKYIELIEKTESTGKTTQSTEEKKRLPSVIISKQVFFGIIIQIYGEKIKIISELGPSQFSYESEERKICTLPFKPHQGLH
ncbi:MAG TPA: FapA family protein [Thermotogota bacterium]|nr:FapA family protein [Thermotogota bacterium]